MPFAQMQPPSAKMGSRSSSARPDLSHFIGRKELMLLQSINELPTLSSYALDEGATALLDFQSVGSAAMACLSCGNSDLVQALVSALSTGMKLAAAELNTPCSSHSSHHRAGISSRLQQALFSLSNMMCGLACCVEACSGSSDGDPNSHILAPQQEAATRVQVSVLVTKAGLYANFCDYATSRNNSSASAVRLKEVLRF